MCSIIKPFALVFELYIMYYNRDFIISIVKCKILIGLIWKNNKEIHNDTLIIQLRYNKQIKVQIIICLTFNKLVYFSSHHSFSFLTCSSSLGVKSFLMLNVFRISSGVLPLIILATVLQVTSNKPLMSR